MCLLSCFSGVQLFATSWTVALQAPLSIGFSWQEYWSELPFPPPVDLPDPETEHVSLTPPALAGGFFTTSATWEAHEEVVLIRVFQMLRWLCRSYIMAIKVRCLRQL